MMWLSFLIPPARAHDYTQALEAARQAAWVQSGADAFLRQLQGYGEDQVKRQVRKSGYEREVGLITVGYLIYRNRQIIIPFQGKRVSIQADRITLEINL